MASPHAASQFTIRAIEEKHLAAADRVFRIAFGTFLGLPNPEQFGGDTDYIATRWRADRTGAFSAFDGDRLIAAVLAVRWGSFGFLGPLVVDPGYWERGVAQLLLGAVMETFRTGKTRHVGLYTFAQSPKHNALYRKFGFWPRDLVANMERTVGAAQALRASQMRRFSKTAAAERQLFLANCREISGANFYGLDLTQQIESNDRLGLGDTLLFSGSSQAAEGFALCYAGRGTEAGSGVCHVKFAAVQPGTSAGEGLVALLRGCETFAESLGAHKLTLAVNMARREAFSLVGTSGFQTLMQGLAMETGNEHAGYNHSGVYILDDWR